MVTGQRMHIVTTNFGHEFPALPPTILLPTFPSEEWNFQAQVSYCCCERNGMPQVRGRRGKRGEGREG